VIVPMALFNLIGSLQNIESAEAAGDSYPTAPSLAVNGLGSIAAACFGSAFPTTIYIGHPGWKAMGARAGYSTLNCLFFAGIALTGWLAPIAWAVPVDAGMAIVLWIGIVITAQAFTATPREHAPAVVVGLLPGVGAWGVLMIQTTLGALQRTPGVSFPAEVPLDKLGGAFESADLWIYGALSLEKGFIFTSMILAAVTAELTGRNFVRAALWSAAGAVISLTGVMHAYAWSPARPDSTAAVLFPPLAQTLPFAAGYAVMAGVFLAARYVTEPTENGHGAESALE
jgi:AGZA family xanthine/uracil permease-like MFS transporter